MPVLSGFDVSHYQGIFDWARMVLKYKITLGCCKVSEGAFFVDPTWQQNRHNMQASSLRYIGLYHWLSPGVPAEQQLRNFQRIGGLGPGEWTMLDIEENGLTQGEIIRALRIFGEAYPGRLMRYQGAHFVSGDTDAYNTGEPWVLPWYGPSTLPSTVHPVTLWQWGGKALGIEHIDSNQIINLGEMERVAGYAQEYTHVEDEDDNMHDGFVQDTEGNFWARGVDFDPSRPAGQEWQQWAVPIQRQNIKWELYQIELKQVPTQSLRDVERLPVGPIAQTPSTPPSTLVIDYNLLADVVANKIHDRMAA